MRRSITRGPWLPKATLVMVTLLFFAARAGAQPLPTDVTVRVLAKDAKFVGTSMGGVEITIKDVDSGEILARGVTAGSTGNTSRIVLEPRERGKPISTEGSAQFTATLPLTEPRLVEISAYGPRAQRQGANRISVTQWVIPGKPIVQNDAILLIMPGFLVDVLAPPAHLQTSGLPQSIELKANVVMMCGCPIQPDGLWDANRYEVRALLKRNGENIGELPLQFAGQTSQFSASWDIDEPGTYEAIVYAYDPTNGNTGVDQVTFRISED